MVGLMLKDLLTMRRYLKSLLGVCVLLGAMGFILKSPSYVSGVGGVTSFLVCMVSFSYDENAKWDAYGLTLPVTRKTCVQAKYLLSLAMVGAGGRGQCVDRRWDHGLLGDHRLDGAFVSGGKHNGYRYRHYQSDDPLYL